MESKRETQPGPAARVGHVVSLFPVASETFVADALLACRAAGQEVWIFSLRPPRPEIIHPHTSPLFERLSYPIHPLMPGFWSALGGGLVRRPGVLLSCLFAVLGCCGGSPRVLVKNLYALLRGCQIAAEARRAGLSALYAHFSNSPATAAWTAARMLELPFGLHAHGFDLEAHPRLLARIARDARLRVVVSESGRRFLGAHLGQELGDSFEVHRCGVELPAEPPARPPAPFRILSVGRLRRGKGFAALLPALGRLDRAGLDFHCRIVGDGPLRGELAALAEREGIAPRVTWLGMLPRPRVLAEMAAAHAVALPLTPVAGEREGLPVVVLEAMAQGAAVVSSPLYGIPEVVEHEATGLLVPPGDSVGLAAALRRLAEEPALRDRLAAAARARIARDFQRDACYGPLAARISALAVPNSTRSC